MCGTCPFREGSPHAELAPILAEAAVTNGNRICHSTGGNNAINRRTGNPARICRGARDVQLKHFHALGVLNAPTDEAWADALVKRTRR